jgi:hypothetical protein
VLDQVLGIGRFACGVNNQQQVVFTPRHHQVIKQAALFIGEKGIALLV